jgi:hypothetical protein
MACSKYIVTNTGSTITNFNYRRCDDSMWEYQVELLPAETKNIWLINGTYSTAFNHSIELVNTGTFPPLNATATPTPTPTVTIGLTPTATQSQTPTTTPTNTPTPSVTPTQTGTASVTATPTPSVTTTPTSTQILTPTPTHSGTPAVTPTPTPSSFGTNTFKVRVLSGGKAQANNFTLTEIPYVGSSGVGFTGTTGSYPLNWSGGTNYGTHQQISGDTVSFLITSSGNATLDILYYKNGSIQLTHSQSITSVGVNTVNFYIAGAASATPSDKIEFQIS